MKDLFGEEIKKEDTVEEDFKKKSEGVFDVLGIMFKNPNEFAKKPLAEKAKHFFMMNRLFAIKQPNIANAFNTLKINSGQAVQCWGNILGGIYNTTPPWIYKTLSASKAKKTNAVKKNSYSEEAALLYRKRNMIGEKEFNDLLEFCPERMMSELADYELLLNSDFEKKKSKK